MFPPLSFFMDKALPLYQKALDTASELEELTDHSMDTARGRLVDMLQSQLDGITQKSHRRINSNQNCLK